MNFSFSDLIVAILAAISLIGIIVLSVMGIGYDVLVTVLTTLIGYFIGTKKDGIIGGVKRIAGK